MADRLQQPWTSPPNQVLAGPAAGADDGGIAPRALVAADMPPGAISSEAASMTTSGGLASSAATSGVASGGLANSRAQSSATSGGLAASVAMSLASS